MSSSARRALPLVLVPAIATLAMFAACSRTQPEQKAPLNAPAAQPAKDPLSADARAALDQANTEFRTAKYNDALTNYRKAAKLAPTEAAPYFGIFMAAQKLGNKALADSASKAIADRNGQAQMLTDASLKQLHSTK